MVENDSWKIVWSGTSIKNLKKAHSHIWKQSFSKRIADKVIAEIYSSTKPLKNNPYIYNPIVLRGRVMAVSEYTKNTIIGFLIR